MVKTEIEEALNQETADQIELRNLEKQLAEAYADRNKVVDQLDAATKNICKASCRIDKACMLLDETRSAIRTANRKMDKAMKKLDKALYNFRKFKRMLQESYDYINSIRVKIDLLNDSRYQNLKRTLYSLQSIVQQK